MTYVRMSQKMESVTARVLEMQAESAGENVNQVFFLVFNNLPF